jgi:hypothetical protein
MNLDQVIESGQYIIMHKPTCHISRVWIEVYETAYQVEGEFFDKDFFHHYHTVREPILSNPSSTLGDSPTGEDME